MPWMPRRVAVRTDCASGVETAFAWARPTATPYAPAKAAPARRGTGPRRVVRKAEVAAPAVTAAVVARAAEADFFEEPCTSPRLRPVTAVVCMPMRSAAGRARRGAAAAPSSTSNARADPMTRGPARVGLAKRSYAQTDPARGSAKVKALRPVIPASPTPASVNPLATPRAVDGATRPE